MFHPLVVMAAVAAPPSPVWSPVPNWIREGPPHIGEIPISAATVGDFDADGMADVAIVVRQEDSSVVVEVFRGTSLGLGALPDVSWTVPTGDATAYGVTAVSADVTGDGFDDLILGEPSWPDVWASPRPGAVVVVAGGPSGLDILTAARFVGPNAAEIDFGSRIASPGDTNGDGFDDLVLWSRTFPSPDFLRLYLGSVDGLGLGTFDVDRREFWPGAFPVGDVDLDGFADLAITDTTNDGSIEIFAGSALGMDAVPDWALSGSNLQGLGDEIAAGDVTGDGLTDLVELSYYWDEEGYGCGAGDGPAFLHLYRGTATGFEPTSNQEFELGNSAYGMTLATLGDVTGDGVGDVAVWDGVLSILPGGPAGLPGRPWTDVRRVIAGAVPYTVTVSSGDLDGDGDLDLIAHVQVQGGFGFAESLGQVVVWMLEPPPVKDCDSDPEDTDEKAPAEPDPPQGTDTGLGQPAADPVGAVGAGCGCAGSGTATFGPGWAVGLALVAVRRRSPRTERVGPRAVGTGGDALTIPCA